MTEFETAVLTAINGLQEQMQGMQIDIQEIKTDISGLKSEITGIKSEIKTINNRLDSIESDIEDIKENTVITRTAANYNGEKIEELATELQKANIIA